MLLKNIQFIFKNIYGSDMWKGQYISSTYILTSIIKEHRHMNPDEILYIQQESVLGCEMYIIRYL